MRQQGYPVLVAGAVNTDLVATMRRAPRAGETVVGTSFSIHGGGKAANQAVALARSGTRVALIAATGADDFGRARREDLLRDGVAVDWVMEDPGKPSGVAIIFVEDGGENRIAHVLGATESVDPPFVERALASVRPSWLLATNELPEGALHALIRAAKTSGSMVVLNATPDPMGTLGILDSVDILIVNEVEAAALLGKAHVEAAEAALIGLRERGIGTVVLTVGKDGALATDDLAMIHHRPPVVPVVDTTGAGDAFCGAFVSEMARGASLDAAVAYGVRAGAISVTRAGAQSSIPTREEIARH
jgi:ribokinase